MPPERPPASLTRLRAPTRTGDATATRMRRGAPAARGGAPRAFDRDALARQLRAGLAVLGLPERSEVVRRLVDYLALLAKWNTTYSLTAIRDPAQMLSHHLLDSLAVVAPLAACLPMRDDGPTGQVLDVGSGAGLPGIVLALAWPAVQVRLVEPTGKKAAFLRQCQAELALANVTVAESRVEALPAPVEGAPAGHFPDLIICRAFASLADFARAVEPLVGPATTVAAMKGVPPLDEIAELPTPWTVRACLPLAVPDLDAERCLVLLARSPNDRLPAAHDTADCNRRPKA